MAERVPRLRIVVSCPIHIASPGKPFFWLLCKWRLPRCFLASELDNRQAAGGPTFTLAVFTLAVAVPADVVAAMREHKARLLELLAQEPGPIGAAWDATDWRDF